MMRPLLSLILGLWLTASLSAFDVEMVIQNGHTESVKSVAFSPDGRFIVSGSTDKTIKLWSVEGDLLRTFDVHSSVQSVAFSPDGRFVAGALADKTVRLWSANGELINTYSGHTRSVRCVAFSPDGRYLASGADDLTVKLWSVEGQLIRTFAGHSRHVSSIAFSPDGQIIASGSYDETIKLWSLDGELIRTFQGRSHQGEWAFVHSLVFSHDGRYIVGGLQTEGNTENVKLWSVDGELVRGFHHERRTVQPSIEVAFSPDDRYILTGSTDDDMILWSVEGRQIRVIEGHTGDVTSVAFSPNGKYIVSGSTDKTIKLWSLEGELVHSFEGYTRRIWCVAFSSDGNYIAGGLTDGTIKVWSAKGQLVRSFEDPRKKYPPQVFSVAFSPAGRYLASGSDDGFVRLWSVDGELVRRFIPEGHDYEAVRSVAFSPDGRFIAAGSEDKKIRLWSVEGWLLQGGLVRTYQNPRGVWSVAFSPDGKYIAGGLDDGKVILWSAEWESFRIFSGHDESVRCVAYSPDGRHIASGSTDGTIGIWSVEGELIRVFEGAGRVNRVAFSPEGSHIISVSVGGKVRVWSLAGKPIRTLGEHAQSVTDVAVSSDGQHVVSCSLDTTIKTWNLQTGDSLSLIPFGREDWFVSHENGRFDCSDGGRKHIRFVEGTEFYGPEQFWDSFYTPGLLKRFIEGERFRDADITEAAQNAPVVRITSTAEETTEKGSAEITIQASAKNNGVGKIFLIHNGRTLDQETRGIGIRKERNRETYTASLLQGVNLFQGGAYDRDDRVYGLSNTVRIIYKPREPVRPNMHILSVGVSNYQDRNIRLKAPEKDARAVARVLAQNGSTLYKDVHVMLLTEQKAGKVSIENTLNDLVRRTKKEDTVVIFLSGHGDIYEETFFFLPYDADITDYRQSCISVSSINEFIKDLPANKVLLILDTCHSGAAAGAIAMSRGGLLEARLLAGLAQARGIIVFSSSSETQYAYEIEELGYGIFTYCLLDALANRKRDIADEGYIMATKLLGTVNRATRRTAYKYLNIEQSPKVYFFGDDFSLGKVE